MKKDEALKSVESLKVPASAPLPPPHPTPLLCSSECSHGVPSSAPPPLPRAGGCEISVSVAVDFTASNKKPTDPDSLHYRHPTAWNSYQTAIIAVGGAPPRPPPPPIYIYR